MICITHHSETRNLSLCFRKIGTQLVDYKVTAGEDVSEYLNKVPGVFALVGVRNQEKGAIFPQHNPLLHCGRGCFRGRNRSLYSVCFRFFNF